MSSMPDAPACKGHYLLLLKVDRRLQASIGMLGTIQLDPGIYIYVGSAHGPGGLRARLRRHLCGARKRVHWHIDMLIESGAHPIIALAACSAAKQEESLARACLERCSLAAPRFGSTDAPGSPGHLYYCGPSLGEALLAAARCMAEAPRKGPRHDPGHR